MKVVAFNDVIPPPECALTGRCPGVVRVVSGYRKHYWCSEMDGTPLVGWAHSVYWSLLLVTNSFRSLKCYLLTDELTSCSY